MKRKKLWNRLCAGLLITALVAPSTSGIVLANGSDDIVVTTSASDEVPSTEANYMSDEDYAAFGFTNLPSAESFVEGVEDPLNGYQPMIMNELYIGHMNHPDDYAGYFATADNVATISAENLNLNTMQNNNVGGKQAYFSNGDVDTQCIKAIALTPGDLREDGAELREQILIETRLYQDTDGRDSSDYRVQAYSLVNGQWQGGTEVHKRLDSKDDWVGLITIREQGGFNSMTVGDFDGDNYNEVAVFCPVNAESSGAIYLYQPVLQSNGTYNLVTDGEYWIKDLGSRFNWADAEVRPMVSMATASMAGRDDIVLSVTLPYNTKDEACNDGIVAVLQYQNGSYVKVWENSLTNASGNARFKLQNVTNADLNGDGREEIVIAGHKNTGYKNGDSRGSIDEDKMFVNVLLYNGSNYYLAWENGAVEVPRHPDLYVDNVENDPISLTAGKYFTGATNEVVFCEGVFLHFSEDSTQEEPNKQIENGTFSHNPLENLKFSNTDEAFVGTVATGCFVEDQRIVEQTVVMHGHNALGDDTCDINVTWFYGSADENGNALIGQIEANNDYINDADEDGNGTCLVLAPVNVDGDSYYVKYQERYYGYTNPSVIGVLLSQPYWEEVEYDVANGSTSLTISYTEGSSITRNGTAGIDFHVSAGVRGTFLGNEASIGLDGGVAVEYVGSGTTGNSLTQEIKFTGCDEDMVVVSVVPVVTYCYDAINPVTNETESFSINTSYTPAFANMSVEKYNSVAEQFNLKLSESEEKLTIIDLDEDFYKGYVAGDPSSYPNKESDILGAESGGVLSSQPVSIDINGNGSTEFSISKTDSTSRSDGFNVSWQIGVAGHANYGLVIFDIGGGSYLDLSAHLTGSGGWATASSSEEGFTYSGNVVNLPISAQTGVDGNGNPTSDYAFSTQLVQWNHTINTLKDANSDEVVKQAIPFVGYITTTLLAPPRRVQDLEVTGTTKHSVQLKWSRPEDRSVGDSVVSVDSYELYMSRSAEGDYQLVDGEISGDQTSYLVANLESGVTYYFKIKSISKEQDRGVMSPVATGTTKGSGAPFIVLQPVDIEVDPADCPEYSIKVRPYETDGVITYQWERYVGTGGVEWEAVEGATEVTFNPAYQETLNPTGILGGYNEGDGSYVELAETRYRCIVTETHTDGCTESVISNEVGMTIVDDYRKVRGVVHPTITGIPRDSNGEVYEVEGEEILLQYGFEEVYMSNTALELSIIDVETGECVPGFPMEVMTGETYLDWLSVTTLKHGLYYAVVKYAGSDTKMPAESEVLIIRITDGLDVIYELDGGTNPSSNPVRISKWEEKTWLLEPKKENSEFLGWYLDADFTTPLGGDDKNTLYPSTIETDSITVYAKWEEDTYPITYELNGGVNGDNPSEITANEKITLREATKEGYTFEGWYLDSEFTIPCEAVAGADKQAVTVYAKWSAPVEYRIQYIVGEGVNSADNPDSYTIESAEIIFADATSETHTFTGWYTDAELKTKVTSIPTGSTGDVTVYAGWELMDKLEPNADGAYEIDSYEDLIAMALMVKNKPEKYASATYIQTDNIVCGMFHLRVSMREMNTMC